MLAFVGHGNNGQSTTFTFIVIAIVAIGVIVAAIVTLRNQRTKR